jgi:hypothetical protein
MKIELIGIIIAFLGLIFTILKFISEIKKQRHTEERQNLILRLSFFAEYTRRYHDIIMQLPDDIYDDNFDFDRAKHTIMCLFHAYFDLCSEEWHLRTNESIIDDNVWNNWVEGMTSAFKKKVFREAWYFIIKADVNYYDKEFRNFVTEKLIK